MNNLYSQSPHTTEIVSESSSEIKIVLGDGKQIIIFISLNLKFNLKILNASNISISLNLTEATFELTILQFEYGFTALQRLTMGQL